MELSRTHQRPAFTLTSDYYHNPRLRLRSPVQDVGTSCYQAHRAAKSPQLGLAEGKEQQPQ